jgi:hypothetical protein
MEPEARLEEIGTAANAADRPIDECSLPGWILLPRLGRRDWWVPQYHSHHVVLSAHLPRPGCRQHSAELEQTAMRKFSALFVEKRTAPVEHIKNKIRLINISLSTTLLLQ